jgi:transcriptional regulator with XRE-family HTH domain
MNQGAKFKFLAERSGKTNADIAILSGISEGTVYNYFREEEINSKNLKKICLAMGWNLQDFYKTEKLLEDESPGYGLKYEVEALKREVELLKQQLAAKEEIIELLKTKHTKK